MPAARRGWERLAEAFPDARLILEEAGLFRFREARFGIDAADRLHREGLGLFRRVLAKTPDAPRPLYMLGTYERDHKEVDAAWNHLRAATEAADGFALALVALGRLEADRGLEGLAEAHLRAAAAVSDQGLVSCGRFLEKAGRYAEARAFLDRAWDCGELQWSERVAELSKAGRWHAVRELAQTYRRFYPGAVETPAAWERDAACGAGDLEAAYALRLAERKRRPAAAEISLALGELALRLGRRDAAVTHFADALAVQVRNGRSDLDLRRRLRSLQGRAWLHPQHDLSRDAVDGAAYTAARFPSANQAQLLRVEVHRVYPDRSVESLVHHAIKLFDKRGIDALGELALPHDPDDLLLCRTVLPDGQVFSPTNIKKLDFSKAASMYRMVPGAVLEYAFRRDRRGGETASFTDSFEFTRFNVPLAWGRYVLILPRRFLPDLSVKAWPRHLAPRQEAHGTDVALVWDLREQPPRLWEKFMARREELLPNLRVRLDGPDFDGQVRQYRVPPPLQTGPVVVAAAREAVAGCADAEARIRALHAFLRRTLRPASGARTPRDALALGTASDSVAQDLYRALAEAAGLVVWPGEVNARWDRCLATAAERRSLIGQFSTPVLTFEPAPGARDWLRLRMPVRQYRPADLGAGLHGAPVLVRGPDGWTRLERVRGAALEQPNRRVELSVALQADGAAAIRGDLHFYGSAAASLRQLAERPQQGPRQLDRIATGYFPKLVLAQREYPRPEVEYAGRPDAEAEPFRFRFAGTVEQFCRPEEGAFSFCPWPQPFGVVERLLGPRVREWPFRLTGDVERRQAVVYTAPPGHAFTQVPQSAWWEGEFGLYGVHFVVRGRTLRASRFLLLPAGELSPEQYPALAAFLEACQQSERWTVRFAPLADLGWPGAVSEVVESRPVALVDRRALRHRWWPESAAAAEAEER